MPKAVNKMNVLSVLIMFFSFQAVWAVDYYVSKTGSDGNPGTAENPWLTIQKAANTATPGSTVYIKAGTYNEKVNIGVSGNAIDGYITFQNYESDTVILDGTGLSVSGRTALLNIDSKSYIIIKGLQICNLKTSTKDNVPVGILVTGTAGYIELRNNYIHHIANTASIVTGGNGRDAHGLAVYGTNGTTAISNIIIDGNEISNCTLGSSESMVVNGNVDTFEITNNVVHDNDNIGIDCIGYEGTAPANDQARNGLVRGNTVYNITTSGNPSYRKSDGLCADGIYVDGGKDIVIERNIVHHVDIGIEVASEHSGKTTTGVTVRSNLIYKCNYTGLAFGGYDTSVGWTDGCSFLNNTLIQNNTTGDGTGDILIQQSRNNVVKNNIVYTSPQNIPVTNPFDTKSSYNNTFDYNLYFTPGGVNKSTWNWNDNNYLSFAAYKAASGQDANSLFADPLFANLATFDIFLKDASPAIDTGDPAYAPAASEKDLFGNDRLSYGRVDIGAFENNGTIATNVTTLSVNEDSAAVFEVKLTTQPSESRTVTVARFSGDSDSDITVLSGATLVFTSANWDTYQDVTLAAAKDADTLNGNATIICSSSGLPSKFITATEIDNDCTLTVSSDGKGTTVHPAGTTIVQKGTATDITAVAADYPFVNWTGSGNATIANANLENTTATLTGNATVTAIFQKPILNGTAITAISGTAGSRREYKITVPANPAQTILEVKAYGGTGDADLTVSGLVDGEQEILYASGSTNNETLQVGSPSGDYIISLNAKTDYAGLTLTAKYYSAKPTTPTTVAASRGTYHDAILVTWKASAGAASYLIYRNDSKVIPLTSISETSDTSLFDNDISLEAGKPYYYWIKAKNEAGTSTQSAMASGNISNSPVAPATVRASDGTYFDKIRVTWPKVPGATLYLVYRTESPDTPTDPPVAKTAALYYDDFDGSKSPRNKDGTVTKYWYWITAKNHDITSAISTSNAGYLSSKGPAKVTAKATYTDGIVVTWAAVPGATSYDVYRFPDSKSDSGEEVKSAVAGLEYEDKPPADNKYYRVRAKYGSYYSAFSVTGAMGKLGLSSPPNPTSLGNGETSSDSGIMKKGSFMYFYTEVPMGTTRLIATLEGTTKAVTNDCNLFAKFANFPTVSSYNAKGVENKDNEILTVSNPSPGTWYFLLYGVTEYDNVTLTVNYYSVANIVLTQVPANEMAVPFTAVFKGKVVDEIDTGIASLSIQVRNPITKITSFLPAKTDAKGLFVYSTEINTEGEYTFDFFFSAMPDTAKGTASHTVWTRKGSLLAAPNNFFNRSAYLPATPVPFVQSDVLELQHFLNTRNGWDEDTIESAGETLWVGNTLMKAKDDAQLLSKLDDGLYMFFYGVEGAGIGNDMTANSAFSAVPFVVHVDSDKQGDVLTKITELIDPAVKTNVENKGVGVVVFTAVNNPVTGLGYDISLFADQQLELLANIAGKTWTPSDITEVDYSGVTTKRITITLATGRKINVAVSSFLLK